MIQAHFLKSYGTPEEINLSQQNVGHVVTHILSKSACGNNIAIALDIDKTLVFPTPQNGMIEAAPDAFYPPGLKETIQSIQSASNIICFSVSGRSTDFIKTHFDMNGSGQFHAEMSDVFSGEHTVLKPTMKLASIEPKLRQMAEDQGGFLEDDKSHHLCVMCDMTSDFLAAAVGMVDDHNKKHGSALIVEHGDDFFEVGPAQTCKRTAFQELTDPHPFFDTCFSIYCGDTPDKDGPAMDFVKGRGGLAIAVGDKFKDTHEFLYVPSPTQIYQILDGIESGLNKMKLTR